MLFVQESHQYRTNFISSTALKLLWFRKMYKHARTSFQERSQLVSGCILHLTVGIPESSQATAIKMFASCADRYGYKAHTNAEYEEKTEQIRQQMTERDVVVTKDPS